MASRRKATFTVWNHQDTSGAGSWMLNYNLVYKSVKASRRFSGEVSMCSDSELCYETNFLFCVQRSKHHAFIISWQQRLESHFSSELSNNWRRMHMNSVKLEQDKMLQIHPIFSLIFSLCSICLLLTSLWFDLHLSCSNSNSREMRKAFPSHTHILHSSATVTVM